MRLQADEKERVKKANEDAKATTASAQSDDGGLGVGTWIISVTPCLPRTMLPQYGLNWWNSTDTTIARV